MKKPDKWTRYKQYVKELRTSTAGLSILCAVMIDFERKERERSKLSASEADDKSDEMEG